MDCTYIGLFHSFEHSKCFTIHLTFTGATGCHARCQPAHQDHFLLKDMGSGKAWLKPATLLGTTAQLPGPQVELLDKEVPHDTLHLAEARREGSCFVCEGLDEACLVLLSEQT